MHQFDLGQIGNMSLFFLAGIIWQFFTHFVRFLMLKYYFSKGYRFKRPEYGVLISTEKMRNLGMSDLGWSYHPKSKVQLSWIFDAFYAVMCFAVPLYFLTSLQKFYSFEVSTIVIVIWFLIQGAMLIYFNARRYKYYKEHWGPVSWINPNNH